MPAGGMLQPRVLLPASRSLVTNPPQKSALCCVPVILLAWRNCEKLKTREGLCFRGKPLLGTPVGTSQGRGQHSAPPLSQLLLPYLALLTRASWPSFGLPWPRLLQEPVCGGFLLVPAFPCQFCLQMNKCIM